MYLGETGTVWLKWTVLATDQETQLLVDYQLFKNDPATFK